MVDEKVVEVVKSWMEEVKNGGTKSLILVGPSLSGKTVLAQAICDVLGKRRKQSDSNGSMIPFLRMSYHDDDVVLHMDNPFRLRPQHLEAKTALVAPIIVELSREWGDGLADLDAVATVIWLDAIDYGQLVSKGAAVDEWIDALKPEMKLPKGAEE